MSFYLQDWVEKADFPGMGREKAVYQNLAHHADDDGTNAFPSIARIAFEKKLSRRMVSYYLKKLKADEFISEQKNARHHGSVTYRLHRIEEGITFDGIGWPEALAGYISGGSKGAGKYVYDALL